MAAFGVLIAVIGLLMGFIFWQNAITRSDVRAEFGAGIGSLREEFGAGIASVRTEISDLRIEVSADVESLRAEIGELGERMTRLEILFQDQPPSAP